MIDLFLIAALGFLGSFGHCVGMCGPIAAAFSFSLRRNVSSDGVDHQTVHPWQQPLYFHSLLNLGRLLSYVGVGAGIGAVSSVVVAGGQWAGVGSLLRQGIAMATGLLLIGLGAVQLNPGWQRSPLLHPLTHGSWHQRLSQVMGRIAGTTSWWTPALLGLFWGLIPCGFLYTAQLKAAEASSAWQGAITMLAFGLGTLPTMLGVGMSAGLMSRDRRSQLYRMGGWITLAIGLLTLIRSGSMVDLTGHISLALLMLTLAARPISRLWSAPLKYRRSLGVGAFIFALAHTAHMITMGWNLATLPFLLPSLQVGGWAGGLALVLMLPLALTSFDGAQKRLGANWRRLHLLSVPVLGLAVVHTILVGSHYLGRFGTDLDNWWTSGSVGAIALAIGLLRWRWIWSLFFLDKLYGTVRQESAAAETPSPSKPQQKP